MLPSFNFGNQCLNLYCPIENCAYCFSNDSCTLCLENYTISATGGCESAPSACPENCLECTDGVCTEC